MTTTRESSLTDAVTISLLEEAARRLGVAEGSYGAVLHGSHANGTVTVGSDVDFMLQAESWNGGNSSLVFEFRGHLVDASVNSWERVYNELATNRFSIMIHMYAGAKLIKDVKGQTGKLVNLAKKLSADGPKLTLAEANAIAGALIANSRYLTRMAAGRDVVSASFCVDITLLLLFDFESKITGYFANAKPMSLLAVVENHAPQIAHEFRKAANPKLSIKRRVEVMLRIMRDQDRRLATMLQTRARILG